MTAKKPPKKTDALTLRLDPRTKFLIELLSRNGHQSITGVIESAVSRLGNERRVKMPWGEASLSVASERLWSPIESDRVVNLALFAPSLLTHEESCIAAVLEAASHIFFNRYEVRGEQDVAYRSHATERLRGVFREDNELGTVFVTPKRNVIRLAWDLITERAEEIAEKGLYIDIDVLDVEEFIGKPLSSIPADIRAPGVIIQDEDGIAYLGADKETGDIMENLGVKR
ncbi:hypothetical protein [Pseudomonas syringae]|uniref:hypothetical protein n=1 Tax=Pseudomonas syringae TaxID=317 RepID=UPI003CE73095